MKYNSTALLIALLFILLTGCKTKTESKPDESGKEVYPFELSEVTLLDGPFKHATDLNINSLLNYEPDRLLSKFRSEAGLQAKAPPYEGWEAETIAGHSLGHYLSACALMYQSTNDERFLERVNYIVNELGECQMADGDGYFGAFPNGKKILEEEVATGDIRSQGFDLNGIWVPYYTQHKLMAGLRDAYHLCGITKALEIEIDFADWLGGIVENLNHEQIQEMLDCEHGGINEVLVDLYIDTDNEKFLQLSRIFHHESILDSLAAEVDILPGKHGNTQIPKLIGLARRYEATGDPEDKNAALFFWKTVVDHHSYTTGGHGNHEYFGQPDQLRNRLSDETTETCNVYNMLKLTHHIFQWDPSAKVADYYERALFNHILASQHPRDGRVIYNLSLEMGGRKNYEDPEWFTCCVGTGMETHSKYGKNIFFKNETELYVSQFIAARVNWEEKGVTLSQYTNFPEEQGTNIEVECESPQKFTLYLRYPYWAIKGIEIRVNGKKHKIRQNPESYIALKREWKSGDKVEVSFPFSLRLDTMPDDNNRVAILYGPLVLAGDLGAEDDPSANDPEFVPILLTEERDPRMWLSPTNNRINSFTVSPEVAQPRNFVLRPFYLMHERRYSVYWDLFSNERWSQYQFNYQAELKRKKDLEAKTMDFFQPGEMQEERDHNFRGEKIRVMDFRHNKARVADRGGWFSFELNIDSTNKAGLVIHYWGGFTGSKTFDILVNGEKIATENISGKKDGEFIDIQYDIPESLILDGNKIVVKFQPHEGSRGGPIFGARTIFY